MWRAATSSFTSTSMCVTGTGSAKVRVRRRAHKASELQWLQQLAVTALLTLFNRVPASRASVLALITSEVSVEYLIK